jgi:hypothetical protein
LAPVSPGCHVTAPKALQWGQVRSFEEDKWLAYETDGTIARTELLGGWAVETATRQELQTISIGYGAFLLSRS